MPLVASALSAVVWAAIVYFLASRDLGWMIWGGVLAAPVIGLAAGAASKGFLRRPWWVRAVTALTSLYATAVLFGAASGFYRMVLAGSGPRTVLGADVVESVLAVLWGLTIMGYVVILWPLAYANHALIATMWDRAAAVRSARRG